MTGTAAGLTCLGLVCLAVLFLPGRPDAPAPSRWATGGCVVLAILFFLIAAGMFFGLIAKT